MLKRRTRRGDDGVSLMELVVTMGITVIVGTMATLFVINAYHLTYRSVSNNQDAATARIALDSWTQKLRVAGWIDPTVKVDRFEEITPTKIVFWANLNNRQNGSLTPDPTIKVALWLNVLTTVTVAGVQVPEGQLLEAVWSNGPGNPPLVRQLAEVARPTGSWMFQPYSKANTGVDTTVDYCKNTSTNKMVNGLCYQLTKAVSQSQGTIDPQLSCNGATPPVCTHQVVSGNLVGTGLANSILDGIGRVDISLKIFDSTRTYATDFLSTATVNSGFQ